MKYTLSRENLLQTSPKYKIYLEYRPLRQIFQRAETFYCIIKDKKEF